MKKRVITLWGLLLLTLVSCATQMEHDTQTQGTVALYFATAESIVGGPAVTTQDYLPTEDGDLVEDLIEQLLAGPLDEEVAESPFPLGVTLHSYTQEGGQVTVDLSEQYGGLSGIDLTVADYCIALTLCQIEGVESVVITVEGEDMAFRSTQQLDGNDVILTGAEEDAVSVSVALWFPRQEGGGLGVEPRELLLTESDNLYEAVVEALLLGPSYSSLGVTAPEGTQLNSVTVENGICTVDFSEEFLVIEDRDLATLMIYGVTNSLCSIDRGVVEGVKFQVDGATLYGYGTVNTEEGVSPDFDLEK